MLISDAIKIVRDDIADEGETPRLTDLKGLRQFQRAIWVFNSVIANEELPLNVKTYSFTADGSPNYAKPDDFMRPLVLEDGSPLAWIDPEQWARKNDDSRVWSIFNNRIYLSVSSGSMLLYYYPTLVTSTMSGASPIPWDGLLDYAVTEFVKIRWMSVDEYALTQDVKLAESLTRASIQSLRPLQMGHFHGPVPRY